MGKKQTYTELDVPDAWWNAEAVEDIVREFIKDDYTKIDFCEGGQESASACAEFYKGDVVYFTFTDDDHGIMTGAENLDKMEAIIKKMGATSPEEYQAGIA